MKRKVYLVQNCPGCRSPETGFYVYGTGMHTEDIAVFHLKKGEIVRVSSTIPELNAFCESCGLSWHEDLKAKWMSKSEIQKLKESKRIDELKIENTMDVKALSGMSAGHRRNILKSVLLFAGIHFIGMIKGATIDVIKDAIPSGTKRDGLKNPAESDETDYTGGNS